ncbi:MAG: DNA mismatch repair protein MutS, partial [Dehalococcoidia bacterium]|nr:DNA mismatch repair protein MutS [Dehalococcoidia bacterium]
ADKSYGIHVAQLAGLPKTVINRAWEVLKDLEGDGASRKGRHRAARAKGEAAATLQMALFNESSQIMEEILRVDVSNLTPLEAINVLYELQEKAKNSP